MISKRFSSLWVTRPRLGLSYGVECASRALGGEKSGSQPRNIEPPSNLNQTVEEELTMGGTNCGRTKMGGRGRYRGG